MSKTVQFNQQKYELAKEVIKMKRDPNQPEERPKEESPEPQPEQPAEGEGQTPQ